MSQQSLIITDGTTDASVDAGTSSLKTFITNTPTVAATQSGTWTVQPGNTQNTTPWLVQDSADGPVLAGTAASKSMLIGGQFNTSLPSLTTGQQAALQVDSSGRLLVGSIASALPTGANTIGAVTQASGPWTQNITQFGGNNVVTGTGASGSGIPRVTVANDSNILATQSGTWTVAQGIAASLSGAWPIKLTDGTNTMPTGDTVGRAIFHKLTDGTNTAAVKAASTAAVATDPALVVAVSPNNNVAVTQSGTWTVQQGTPPWTVNNTQINGNAIATVASGEQKVAVEGLIANGAAISGNPVLVSGYDGANLRTLLTDSSGRLVVAPTSATTPINGFRDGNIVTASTTTVAVRATTYTEQTTNAQRSVVSSSTSDASAGTGARTVKITYYDQTGAGPSTETVTLNGTTAVNTVSSTICFIEKIEVITVGSGGTNAGAITLKAATGGTGATIGTISAGDGRTFWSHHYVANGKTCNITSADAGGKGNQSAGFVIKAVNPTSATAFEIQVSDTLRFGAGSNTISRNFGTPIQVAGPARITVYVTPDGTSTNTFYSAFDFYEQ